MLTVKDVCDRLLTLDGIDKHSIPRYQTRIAEHHINGYVLIQCDLDELKRALDMTFGDWQLFKAMVLQMRGQAMSAAATPHSPSQASSDPLQAEEEEEAQKAVVESADHNDFLNLSYEELRKNSQMSSQRSSIHNSHMSLGTQRSESSHVDTSSGENTPARRRANDPKYSTSTSLDGMLVSMDSGIDQSNKNSQGGAQQGVSGGVVKTGAIVTATLANNTRVVPKTTTVKATASVGTSTGQLKPVHAAGGVGVGHRVGEIVGEKETASVTSSESSTDITAVRRDSREEISEDENTLTLDDDKTEARTSTPLLSKGGDRVKHKLERQIEEEEDEEDERESSPLLRITESTDVKSKGRVKEKLSNGSVSEMYTESSESPLHLSSVVSAEETSSSELGSRQAESEERYQICPALKEQVQRDVKRMFDNLQTEITSRGKDGQGKVVTSPTMGAGRVVRTPAREQQTHDLSLLAGYSTFTPPVRELGSVPESHIPSSMSASSVGRHRRPGVMGGSPIKHSQSVGAIPAPLAPHQEPGSLQLLL